MITSGNFDEHFLERAQARIGSMLAGKYRLDALLGMGGMAAVYRATHRNGAVFAIKVLHPEHGMHKDVRARFLREGYIANSIKHPGVARVVDDEVVDGGDAYIVMELLEGFSADRLAFRFGGQLPIRAVVALGLGVLDVLDAAHAAGVLHRDIKPGNVFVGFDGRVVLLDFGIARAYDAANAGGWSTATGVVLGTPAFMAPEHATGDKKSMGARSDLWSVGAALFTAATGRTVHVAESGPQLLVLAATREAPPMREVRPDVPEPIAGVIDRSLAISADDRWENAAQMRDALRAAAHAAYGNSPGAADLALLFAKGGGLGGMDDTTQVAQPPTPPVRHEPPPGADSLFRAVVQTAREIGVDVHAALEASGVDVAAFEAGTTPTSAQLVDFFEQAAKLAGQPSLGVRIAMGLPLGATGALDYATRTSETFGDALERMARLYSFVSERVGLTIEHRGDEVHIVTQRAEGAPTGPQITEFITALFLGRAREALRGPVPLLSVGFSHPRVPGSMDLAETFGAPVTYEHPRDEFVLPRSMLSARFQTSDPLVAALLESHTQRMTKRPPGSR